MVNRPAPHAHPVAYYLIPPGPPARHGLGQLRDGVDVFA